MKFRSLFFAISLTLTLPVSGIAAEHALFTTSSLTPETALKAVNAAMAECREAGYQVAVAVVDRMGNLQALVRDRFAGAHTPETARRKAWTAAAILDLAPHTTLMIEQTWNREEPHRFSIHNDEFLVHLRIEF